MAKLLHLKLGRYNFPLIYENMTLKPTGLFSNLPPIHIHKKMEMSEIIERMMDGIDIKKFHMISMDVPQKKQKQENLSFEEGSAEEDDTEDCIELIDEIDKKPILGEGSFGEVRLWREDIVVKDEKCNAFNKIFNKFEYGKKFFLTVQNKKKEIAEFLADEGITPRIYAVTRCGNHCLTFMDKIEGETLDSILSDETYTKSKKYKFIESAVNLIKRFHSIMKRNGYDNLGHGDLNQENIMLPFNDPIGSMKLIDLSFERKKTFKNDFDFFFKMIRNYSKEYDLDNEEIDKIEFNNLNEKIPLEIYKSEEIEKKKIDYESPFKVYNTCKDFMNEAYKIKPFETGSNDSEIRIWNEKTKIKTEYCSDLDVLYNPDKDFMKIGKKEIKIIGILANEKITPRIYEIARCGHVCITIMEIFEGKTLENIMKNTSIDKTFKYNLIFKVADVIKKFHKIMKKNGYNFGHGNLSLSNILVNMKNERDISSVNIRLVNFYFIRNAKFDVDWRNFFFGLKPYDLNEKIMQLLERNYIEYKI